MGKRWMWGPSDQGDSSTGTTPGSLQGSLRPSLSSPSKGPEGLRSQTHPYTKHHLHYWHNCTSDSWVLTIRHTGYTLQFHSGLPPFRGITVTSVNDPLQLLALKQEVETLLQKQAICLVEHTSQKEGFYLSATLVEESPSPEQKHKDGSYLQPSSGDDKRIQLRLGGGLGRQRSQRILVGLLNVPAHKRARAESSPPRTATFSPVSYLSSTQEISPLRLSGDHLRVLRAAIWPLLSNPHVFKVHGCLPSSLAARVAAICNCLDLFQSGSTVQLVLCQKLLGLMAIASSAIQLGLLHMHPLQVWLNTFQLHPKRDRPRKLTVSCLCWTALRWWRKAPHRSKSIRMGVIYNHQVVTTNASNSGWGVVWAGRGVSGSWSGC
ncbi:UNVERIFIED_CONTAM: hypothetical protein FKN15_047416 [Acipenser sinensis]